MPVNNSAKPVNNLGISAYFGGIFWRRIASENTQKYAFAMPRNIKTFFRIFLENTTKYGYAYSRISPYIGEYARYGANTPAGFWGVK